MKEEIKQKLREMGAPENQLEHFFELVSQEALNLVFQDYADKSTDQELEVMEQRLRESKSPEHLQTILQEVSVTTYGDQSDIEIRKIYDFLLADIKESLEQTRVLMEKAKAGDPEALKILEDAKNATTYNTVTQ